MKLGSVKGSVINPTRPGSVGLPAPATAQPALGGDRASSLGGPSPGMSRACARGRGDPQGRQIGVRGQGAAGEDHAFGGAVSGGGAEGWRGWDEVPQLSPVVPPLLRGRSLPAPGVLTLPAPPPPRFPTGSLSLPVSRQKLTGSHRRGAHGGAAPQGGDRRCCSQPQRSRDGAPGQDAAPGVGGLSPAPQAEVLTAQPSSSQHRPVQVWGAGRSGLGAAAQ